MPQIKFMEKHLKTHIDEISLNSRHFAAMTEADGVKALIADGFTTDEAWAKKAHKQCVADVKKADAPEAAKADK